MEVKMSLAKVSEWDMVTQWDTVYHVLERRALCVVGEHHKKHGRHTCMLHEWEIWKRVVAGVRPDLYEALGTDNVLVSLAFHKSGGCVVTVTIQDVNMEIRHTYEKLWDKDGAQKGYKDGL
jgi:mitochondrial fission protein ELM1